MKASFILRRAVQVLLPATLLLSACGKDDTPTPTPVPDTGRVAFVNAASHIAPITLKFVVDNAEKASQAYASGSSYQSLEVGSRAVQVTTGSQTALTQSLPIEKDKTYTFFATPSASSSTVGGLLLNDDLTVPGTGKARIRFVNLGQSTPSPLRLSQITTTVSGPFVSDLVTNVASGTGSAFVDFNANVYTLSVLDGSGNTIAVLGDGSGSGTGTYKYMEGKIYTVVLSGTLGSLNNDQKVKAYQLTNN